MIVRSCQVEGARVFALPLSCKVKKATSKTGKDVCAKSNDTAQ